jgi:hypothetical protein
MVLALSVDAVLAAVAAAAARLPLCGAAAWQATVPAGETSAAEAIAGSRAGQALDRSEPP